MAACEATKGKASRPHHCIEILIIKGANIAKLGCLPEYFADKFKEVERLAITIMTYNGNIR